MAFLDKNLRNSNDNHEAKLDEAILFPFCVGENSHYGGTLMDKKQATFTCIFPGN